MDKVTQVISDAIEESGMTIKAVCTKADIPYGRLYSSLKGTREFRVSEFLALCRVLHLDPRVAEEVSV